MNTCLSGLWDRLMEIWYTQNENAPAQCKKDMQKSIKNIVGDKMLKNVRHLKVFVDGLSEDDWSIEKAAERAYNAVGVCRKCAVCQKCAEHFYEVLKGNINERPLAPEFAEYFSDNSQLHYYILAHKRARAYHNINNSLICLKGFSSTTPAIRFAAFSGNACVGGGFYLNVDGYGVVIDPGISYVDNMHQNGIYVQDINSVIVTHDHLDHSRDVETISALQNDLGKYYENRNQFYRKYFDRVDVPARQISWWMDGESKKKNGSNISDCIDLAECMEWTKLSDKISFRAFKTDHIKGGVSYGIKCKLQVEDREVVVGYTSDTKYFPELSKYICDADILIFNISDMYEKDVRGRQAKSGHLGFDGSVRLLKDCGLNTKLAVVSEFCCTNGDFRIGLVNNLKKHINWKYGNSVIIAGEVGMHISLDRMNILCSRCGRWELLEQVVTTAPEQQFGKIEYICRRCVNDRERGKKLTIDEK